MRTETVKWTRFSCIKPQHQNDKKLFLHSLFAASIQHPVNAWHLSAIKQDFSSNKPFFHLAELKRKRQIYAIHSHRKLYECVENIISEKTRVNLDSWNMLIDTHLKKVENDDFCSDKDQTQLKRLDDDVTVDECETQLEAKQYITIGCCGFPNVGKSSLLNTLVGRKVVSVSRTPGHTKHLQTIFLTPNVRLCDCPGLVFPSLVPKPLQVTMNLSIDYSSINSNPINSSCLKTDYFRYLSDCTNTRAIQCYTVFGRTRRHGQYTQY